jgi:RNA polymerase sigma-70 factor, ECF subfamily
MPPTNGVPDERTAASTSRSLLMRLHANDQAAWDRLIALYAPLVWHWCRGYNLPPQDSADIFQEVFQSVAAHIADFHNDRPADTFRGWLRTITKNKVHDHFRQRQREPQAAGGTGAKVWWSRLPDAAHAEEPAADDHAGYPLLFQEALRLIQSEFEEKTWRAFWYVVVDGRSPQDVGAELGMSPGAVRVAKCRVLHRLRQELGDVAG